MDIVVSALFIGSVRAMPGDGRPTGIFKQAVRGAVQIHSEGLVGDAQADRRVHGGPEKAVHHFPIENHRLLIQQFPECGDGFVAGGMGENISTEGLTEDSVCIGDVYVLGSAHLQVSQPRSPCWKIDARHGHEGIASYIATQGIAGWYYRVVNSGLAQAGDALQLISRNPKPVTLREWWNLYKTQRPSLQRLQHVADTPGLTPPYRAKILQRMDWLRRNNALSSE